MGEPHAYRRQWQPHRSEIGERATEALYARGGLRHSRLALAFGFDRIAADYARDSLTRYVATDVLVRLIHSRLRARHKNEPAIAVILGVELEHRLRRGPAASKEVADDVGGGRVGRLCDQRLEEAYGLWERERLTAQDALNGGGAFRVRADEKALDLVLARRLLHLVRERRHDPGGKGLGRPFHVGKEALELRAAIANRPAHERIEVR